ncbi:hypothetical protein FE810_14485 [Thalassotalea litorea]|uniref:Prepilin-type N-terminal cleavage/methylation domain-containing protein n=1 Tax=Thalassotalea litorea TaxID=2020715 RepID=A0A5R9ICX7_9GAMM|nr:hypothetical protein [Thalassotalea litorea]TLU61446.1 hypothetical protein FE810_14485 [Thalassotalea litorea]
MMRLHQQQGVTLIDLILSMALSMVVLGGVLSIYVAVVKSSADTLKSSKLNTQLMSLMSVMSNDIRRAGYWGDFTSAPTINPFNQFGDTALAVINSVNSNALLSENTDANGSCILFSYDENENGAVDEDTEYFGFRLVSGVIEMRVAGTVTDGDSCTNGNWMALSDGDLYTIDKLTFNPKNSQCVDSSEPNRVDDDGMNGIDDAAEANCYNQIPTNGSGDITVETRDIEITVSGALNNDKDVTMEITQSVRVRNDLIRVR